MARSGSQQNPVFVVLTVRHYPNQFCPVRIAALQSAGAGGIILLSNTQITFNEKERAMYPICPFSGNAMSAGILHFGIMIFLLIWIVFVPIAITSRLEKIIKLLEDKKK